MTSSIRFDHINILDETNSTSNDTIKVIELCVQKSFYRHTMPDLGTLTKKNYFKDSILFTSECFPLKYLPKQVDSLNFRIMPKQDICSLLISDSNWETQPHYLCIRYFEKKGSTFDVVIINNNCSQYSNGGGLGITIIKEHDSLKITHLGCFSIN